MGTERICYNCFQPVSGDGPCPLCGYDHAKEMEKFPLALPVGTILDGRYIIGRVLGQGGFGATYIAQRYKTKELIAIKEYLPGEFVTRSGNYDLVIYKGQQEDNFKYGKECFLNEAKTLAKVKGDPNIVEVYSFFEEHNTAYFTMEYVRGCSLQEVVRDNGGRLPVKEANRLLKPVMRAIGVVHSKGIVHRDIAPDNILVDEKGVAKIIDFGAARYSIGEKSCSLDVLLKHGFAPKEQYTRNGHQGAYTDVYAMAATYYYAITGKVPPDAIDRTELDQLVRPSALGSDISPEAEMALLKALSVSAANRYQTMDEFVEELCPADTEEDIFKTTPETLLKRAYEYLKAGEWEKAERYFDVILSEEEEKNAQAWVGKLLAQLKLSTMEDFKALKESKRKQLRNNKAFQKAVEYADPILKAELESLIPEPSKSTFNKYVELIKGKRLAAAGIAALCIAAVVGGFLLYGLRNKNWDFDSATGILEIRESMDAYEGVKQSELPWARSNGEISTITIGDGVQTVRSDMFSNLPSLTKVSIRNGVEKIESGAFRNCRNLRTVTIADTVTEIASNAFSGCSNLTDLSMSSSIRQIGTNAFKDCPAGMRLTYGGSDAQWQAVSVSEGNEGLETAYLTMLRNPGVQAAAFSNGLLLGSDSLSPEMHRMIYRGKNLGNSFTEEQKAAVMAGTFDDIFLGDYWEIDGVIYRVADFDYWLHCGDMDFTAHHLVIVPDSPLYDYWMNDTDVTDGGYANSRMYTEGLNEAKSRINAAFPGAVLIHREFLTNAATNGIPWSGTWYDSSVELMNENMVYGGKVFSTASDGTSVPANYTVSRSQLALFQAKPSMIHNRYAYWLRDVVSGATFAFVGVDGAASFFNATNPIGVRPAFPIG